MTESADFPITAGAYDTSYNGSDDVFVFKLSADGSTLLYSTLVGGIDREGGCGLALNVDGNAVVTGMTDSADFPTTAGAYDTSHNGSEDVFVFKLSADGGTLLYSTFVGGDGGDVGYALALDGAGNVVVTGETRSADFPTTAGAYDTGHHRLSDGFVLRFDAMGGPWVGFDSATYAAREDAVAAVITVTLDTSPSATTTVDYATSDDTATAGSDYTATSGTLAFAPGVTSLTFSVPIIYDPTDEPMETVTLTLSNPVGAALGTPASATLIIVDSGPPTPGALTINDGALSSTATTVTLSLSLVDATGVADMSFSNDGTSWGRWQSYSTSADWELSNGDGMKTVYGRFLDTAGNAPSVALDMILLDSAAGTDCGFTINDGALFTNQTAIALKIGARQGTAKMQVSNDGGFAGAQWEPYDSRKAWQITQYGNYVIPRVVYVKYKDLDGAVSGAYQDDIILDVNAPTGSVHAVPGVSGNGLDVPSADAPTDSGDIKAAGLYSHTVYLPATLRCYPPLPTGPANVTLELSATDDVSGVADMMISNRADFYCESWETYATSKGWHVPEGTTTVYVKFRDNAGNVSDVATDTISR